MTALTGPKRGRISVRVSEVGYYGEHVCADSGSCPVKGCRHREVHRLDRSCLLPCTNNNGVACVPVDITVDSRLAKPNKNKPCDKSNIDSEPRKE